MCSWAWLLNKLSKLAVDQDAFFNADSVSSFVPAPVVTTQQRRRGRNGGRRRQGRNGRRLRNNGRRNQRFQQVSNSFVL